MLMRTGLQRIVCLTEESVEWLYLLGRQELIVGVSCFVKRPPAARSKPVVTTFTHAQTQKIIDLKPDLVLGFSDIQKEIARDLIGAGLNVFITNQRSLEEILSMLQQIGALVGETEKAQKLTQGYEQKIEKYRSQAVEYRPRVYFEEWDEPMISGIRWVSQLIELAGGQDIAAEKSRGVLAQDRFVNHDFVIQANPEIILGCWCGKKVQTESFAKRSGWHSIEAIKNNRIYELPPDVYLQPGPALFEAGLDDLAQRLRSEQWQKR